MLPSPLTGPTLSGSQTTSGQTGLAGAPQGSEAPDQTSFARLLEAAGGDQQGAELNGAEAGKSTDPKSPTQKNPDPKSEALKSSVQPAPASSPVLQVSTTGSPSTPAKPGDGPAQGAQQATEQVLAVKAPDRTPLAAPKGSGSPVAVRVMAEGAVSDAEAALPFGPGSPSPAGLAGEAEPSTPTAGAGTTSRADPLPPLVSAPFPGVASAATTMVRTPVPAPMIPPKAETVTATGPSPDGLGPVSRDAAAALTAADGAAVGSLVPAPAPQKGQRAEGSQAKPEPGFQMGTPVALADPSDPVKPTGTDIPLSPVFPVPGANPAQPVGREIGVSYPIPGADGDGPAAATVVAHPTNAEGAGRVLSALGSGGSEIPQILATREGGVLDLSVPTPLQTGQAPPPGTPVADNTAGLMAPLTPIRMMSTIAPVTSGPAPSGPAMSGPAMSGFSASDPGAPETAPPSPVIPGQPGPGSSRPLSTPSAPLAPSPAVALLASVPGGPVTAPAPAPTPRPVAGPVGSGQTSGPVAAGQASQGVPPAGLTPTPDQVMTLTGSVPVPPTPSRGTAPSSQPMARVSPDQHPSSAEQAGALRVGTQLPSLTPTGGTAPLIPASPLSGPVTPKGGISLADASPAGDVASKGGMTTFPDRFEPVLISRADPSLSFPPLPAATAQTPATGPSGMGETGPGLSTLMADRAALTRHVAGQIRLPEEGESRTRVILRPDGLGAVEVDLRTDPSGRLSVLLRVENPAVLQALRADRDGLLMSLEQSGLDLDGSQLGFEGFGPGQDPDREDKRPGPYRALGPVTPEGATPPSAQNRRMPLIGGGRIDLFT